jgi:hypothetical protein
MRRRRDERADSFVRRRTSDEELTYHQAVAGVLQAEGFTAEKGRREWRREIAGFADEVDIQFSPFLEGVTVNVNMRDEATRHVIAKLAPGIRRGTFYTASERLPSLMGRKSHWWARDDEDGPADVARAVRAYILPFLDRMHSPIELCQYLARFGGRQWGDTIHRLELAIIIGRMGQMAAACEMLSTPPEKLDRAEAAGAMAVRAWISHGCPAAC